MLNDNLSTFNLKPGAGLLAVIILLLAVLLAGCDDMSNQPKYEPFEESAFFPDQRSARPLVSGAVPQGGGPTEGEAAAGRTEDGELVDALPFPLTEEVLERGRDRYDIFCSPCHGLDGYGQGMIVQRGFSQPPSLHSVRLRQAPLGHYYEVITNGFGQMYSYAERVDPADRWSISAYIRALQLSQNASVEDVPPEELQQLQEGAP
jgi:mono/diheme cytochrome c family protein